MSKNKKNSKALFGSIAVATVAVNPLMVGTVTAVSFVNSHSIVANAADSPYQPLINGISSKDGQFTVTDNSGTTYSKIPENPIIAVEYTDKQTGQKAYKYKKFTGKVTLASVKNAYKSSTGGFVDGATYKKDNGELTANDKIYYVTEENLLGAPSLLKDKITLADFHHRKDLVMDKNGHLAAVVRPGSFKALLSMHTGKSINTIAKENNSMLVIEPRITTEELDTEVPADYGAEYGMDDYTVYEYKGYTRYNLFLSHIIGLENADKANTYLELPKGLEIVFQLSNGTEVTTTSHRGMDHLFIGDVFWKLTDDELNIKPGASVPVNFKFRIKQGEEIIEEDTAWRTTNIHITEDITNLIHATRINTQNNFDAGIIDNMDISALPKAIQNEIIAMEQEVPNIDGSTPQNGAMPQYTPTTPDNDKVFIDKIAHVDYSNNTVTYELIHKEGHTTSPIRYLPNDPKLFDGNPSARIYQYICIANDCSEQDTSVLSREDYDLYGEYSKFKHLFNVNIGEQIPWTPQTMHEMDRYWTGIVDPRTMPTLDFNAKVDLNVLTIKETTTPTVPTDPANPGGNKPTPPGGDTPTDPGTGGGEDPGTGGDNPPNGGDNTPPSVEEGNISATGTVIIKYQDENGVELQPDLPDTVDEVVSNTPTTRRYRTVNGEKQYIDDQAVPAGDPVLTNAEYDATQVRDNGVRERPETIEKGENVYRFVQVKAEGSEPEQGTVKEGTHYVVYQYALVQQETDNREERGTVIINYETEDGQAIKSPVTDTDNVLVRTIPTVLRFFLFGGNRTNIDTTPTDGVPVPTGVEYNAAEKTADKDEKPLEIEHGDKIYHFAKVKNDSESVSGPVKVGTHHVTYVYVPEQVEPGSVPLTGSVTVRYVDLEGRPVKGDLLDKVDELVSTTATSQRYITVDGVRRNLDESPVAGEVTASGASYDVSTSEKKPAVLRGDDGREYAFVRQDGATPVSGLIPGGSTVVTYVYAPVEVDNQVVYERGGVEIRYVDTAGATIKDPVVDSADVEVSRTPTSQRYYMLDGQRVNVDPTPVRGETVYSHATYDAQENSEVRKEKPAVIEHGGNRYHWVKVQDGSDAPSGEVTVAGKTVTYVYAVEQERVTPDVAVKSAQVLVNYKFLGTDTPIQEQYVDKENTVIETKDVTVKYYVDADGHEVEVSSVDSNFRTHAVEYDTRENVEASESSAAREEKPKYLEHEGTTYVLVDSATEGIESGVLSENVTVNYYYAVAHSREVPGETRASVRVRYLLDGSDAELRPEYLDTDQAVVSTSVREEVYYTIAGKDYVVESTEPVESSAGASYKVTVEEAPEVLSVDGKTYEKVRVEGVEAGELTQDTVVTYYYRLRTTPVTPTDPTKPGDGTPTTPGDGTPVPPTPVIDKPTTPVVTPPPVQKQLAKTGAATEDAAKTAGMMVAFGGLLTLLGLRKRREEEK